MSLWDDGGTGCLTSKTDRLSLPEDRSPEMDIKNRREDLDRPNISAQDSQYPGPRASRGDSVVTGGSGECGKRTSRG